MCTCIWRLRTALFSLRASPLPDSPALSQFSCLDQAQLPDKRKCFLVRELLLLLLSGMYIFPASQRIDLLLNELRKTHTY